ncbi:hypothetical protein [Novipirellula galeiformis]|uniref:hypothetical protein n=1 Tax=Novipirellula galeiformis TaxID=2528004 RepID=UPI001E54E7D3|nr:hypothetical protein [Novipirellula galeiformis]
MSHPDDHLELIEEANERVDAFTKNRRDTIRNFVVSDFELVGAAIQWLVENRIPCGDSFLEWGSGFGVVTMLAAIEGMDAVGIEVERDLIDQSRRLAEDFDIDAEFVEGSFLPDDRSVIESVIQDFENVDIDSPSAYDALGKSIDEFDLIFAFPWPGEQGYFAAVFDHFAADGALLLTYDGRNQLRLQRRE